MTSSFIRQLIAALLMTVGLALCIAALTHGQADDAPGLGLIGLGAFFGSSFAAFRMLSRPGRRTELS